MCIFAYVRAASIDWTKILQFRMQGSFVYKTSNSKEKTIIIKLIIFMANNVTVLQFCQSLSLCNIIITNILEYTFFNYSSDFRILIR